MKNINKELFSNKLIDQKQFIFLENITNKKNISVYYELRIVLYLGILLFTGGLGYFAYENIGDIGHIISMAILLTGIITLFYFINKHAKPYTNDQVIIQHPYHDYLLILQSLLIVSLFTYAIVYFDIAETFANWSSLISAILFLSMAYRYDNKAILSMGITALTATVGLSISPVGWLKGDFFDLFDTSITGIVFGAFLICISQFLNYKNIKRHFIFSYQNFGLLLYFFGANALLFEDGDYLPAFFMFISAIVVGYYTWQKKEFLFFLYANVFGYIALSVIIVKLLISAMLDDFEIGSVYLLLIYFIASSIGLVSYLLKQKKIFSYDS